MSGPSKEEFYQSLNADTYCGYTWCRRLYGYQITDSAFLERVYARLDELGRDKVKYIYSLFVKLQIVQEMREEHKGGEGMVERIDREYERKVKETEWQKKQGKLTKAQVAKQILKW